MSASDFDPIAESLRREVLAFYRDRGEEVSGGAGLNTLETNSGFVERRGAPLIEILRDHGGLDSLEGVRMLDLGCGFGALSAFFASRGASVIGVDPHDDRFQVGRAVAAEHDLDAEFQAGRMQALDLPDETFDVVVQNNSLCYVVPRDARQAGLSESLRVLRPGGRLVIRNPNRWSARDQFTGIPMIQLLPPHAAVSAARRLGKRALAGPADLGARGRQGAPPGRLRGRPQRVLAGAQLALLHAPGGTLPAPDRPAATMSPADASTANTGAAPPEGGWASVLSARLTRDTGLYTTGAFIGFLLAVINVAVVTHYLTPSEFGQLALLLFFAALTTIFYNLGTLQGTFMWVFGATGDEDVDDDDAAGAHDKRKALGTGLLVTLLICGAGTALIAIFSSQVAQLLLGDSSDGHLVVIAAASGAAGALWRFTTNVLRLERRPYAYVGFSTVRPVLVIGITIPLVATGHGVTGAIARHRDREHRRRVPWSWA